MRLFLTKRLVLSAAITASLTACPPVTDPEIEGECTPENPCEISGLSLLEDSEGDAGYSPSIALYPVNGDSEQAIAVAYQVQATDGTDHLVRLARINRKTETDISITYETVAQSQSLIGSYVAVVAMPNSGALVIVYQDERTKSLYALLEQDNGEFVTLRIDESSADVGRFLDVAADPFEDRVYVSYLDATDNNVKFAVLSGGSVIQGGTNGGLIDNGTEAGVAGGQIAKKTSIAVSPTGQAMASYWDSVNTQLRVAAADQSNAEWTINAIGNAKQTILRPDADGIANLDDGIIKRASQVSLFADSVEVTSSSIAFLSDTEVQIQNFSSGVEYELRYDEPLSRQYGNWSDVVFDSAGSAYVCFLDFYRGALGFAENVDPFGEGEWSVTYPDSVGSVGDFCSIEIRETETSNGTVYQPIVAYYDAQLSALKLTYRSLGSWYSHIVDQEEIAGVGIDLEIDDTGHVILAYRVARVAERASVLRVYRTLPEALQ